MAGGPAYGRVTRTLHWATVVALGAQFVIGYTMDADGSGRGRGRGRGRGGDLDVFGDNRLLTVHVLLGVTVLALAVARLWWRRRTALPPWAPGLSAGERTLAHWTERLLYVVLFAIPPTGLWLVLVSDEAVALHVAAHIVFIVAVAAHVASRICESTMQVSVRSAHTSRLDHAGQASTGTSAIASAIASSGSS